MSGGMVLEFHAYGHKQIARELMRFSEKAQDVSPAWRAIIEEMKSDISEQFESGGTSMSGGWAALKPVTLERKIALGQRTDIMRATDRLFQSLTDERGSDQTMLVGPHEFEFKSEVPYGGYHMGPAKDGSRPARKPIDFTELQRRKYMKELQEYLVGPA